MRYVPALWRVRDPPSTAKEKVSAKRPQRTPWFPSASAPSVVTSMAVTVVGGPSGGHQNT
jgi:hypothetical protein